VVSLHYLHGRRLSLGGLVDRFRRDELDVFLRQRVAEGGEVQGVSCAEQILDPLDGPGRPLFRKEPLELLPKLAEDRRARDMVRDQAGRR
jgi:hypothetical protein